MAEDLVKITQQIDYQVTGIDQLQKVRDVITEQENELNRLSKRIDAGKFSLGQLDRAFDQQSITMEEHARRTTILNSKLSRTQEQLKGVANELQKNINVENKLLDKRNKSIQAESKRRAEEEKSQGGYYKSVALLKDLTEQYRKLNAEQLKTPQGLGLKGQVQEAQKAVDAYKVGVESAANVTNNKLVKGLSNVWSILRKAAYILPGLGIAGLIGIISMPVIEGFKSLYNWIFRAKIATDELNAAIVKGSESAASSASEEYLKIQLIKDRLQNSNITRAEQIRLLNEYNKIADEKNKITKEEIGLTDVITKKMDAQSDAILRLARSSAAFSILQEKVKVVISAESELILKSGVQSVGVNPKTGKEFTQDEILQSAREEVKKQEAYAKSLEAGLEEKTIGKGFAFSNFTDMLHDRNTEYLKDAIEATADAKILIDAENKLNKAIDVYNKTFNSIGKAIDIGIRQSEDFKEPKEKIFNDLTDTEIALIEKYKSDIRNFLNKQEVLDEEGIKQNAKRNLQVRLDEIKKAEDEYNKRVREQNIKRAKAGKALLPERVFSKARLGAEQVFNAEVDMYTKKLYKDREEAYVKHVYEMDRIQRDAHIEYVKSLKESQNRDTDLINDEYYKRIADIEKSKNDALKKIQDEINKGEYGDVERDKTTGEVIRDKEGNAMLKNIEDIRRYTKDRQDIRDAANEKELAANNDKNNKLFESDKKYFDKYLSDTKKFYDTLKKEAKSQYSEQITKDFEEATEGKGADTRFKSQSAQKRFIKRADVNAAKSRKAEAGEDLNAAQRTANDAEDYYKQGKISYDELLDAQNNLANAEENFAEADKALQQKKLDYMAEQVAMYGQIVDTALSAYSTILEAESALVDAQIKNQERRVSAAQKIADRGNAEVLKREEDRLNKLQEMQAKYARQQIIVNQALQVSNALVAVAKAAAAGGGWATIATVIAAVGAIAAGYAAVQSLNKQNTPGFKDGVVDLQGPGTTKSDSIVARLSKRESVMTAKATEANKPVLIAMNKGAKFTMPTFSSYSYGLKHSGNMNNTDIKIERLEKGLATLNNTIKDKKQSWHLNSDGVAKLYNDSANSERKRWKH